MSALPTVHFTHLNIAGRGEIARLALAAGNIPFEDERVGGDTYRAYKAKTPLSQVPTLTVNGTMYSQSMAIARYAAKLSDAYPADPELALRVDMAVDRRASGRLRSTQSDSDLPQKDVLYIWFASWMATITR